ncbi:flagellin [Histidinibacterium lentulum]|uniref:Flagellin C-terminal domain-containing protein n=1 Tax=Histidinibacterium lentulum TaxID=2480588 RepID=A0A3N2R6X2_9RHOB|nr:flagellin [Histidinibacterium lentulum]ROU03230.1 hypothetical protein EAT49_08050 [Histidinibacterium lentulum]
MPTLTTGDLSRHFLAGTRTRQIKAELQTLHQELGTGRVADTARHLGADTGRLLHMDHRLAAIDSHVGANRLTADRLAHMQISLDAMESRRSGLADHALSLPASVSDVQLDGFADAARTGFSAMVADLGVSLAGRRLFGGAASDGPVLASPDAILAELRGAVSGAATADQVAARISDWFAAPGGGFETMGYLGATGAAETQRLGDGSVAIVSVRADSAELRDVLAAAALAAILDGGPPGLPGEERGALARLSGLALLSAAAPFAESRGRLGRAEQAVETATVRLQSERTSLLMQRNDMVASDPFATATRLEAVRTQLQITFEVTARLAGLSFADYIR